RSHCQHASGGGRELAPLKIPDGVRDACQPRILGRTRSTFRTGIAIGIPRWHSGLQKVTSPVSPSSLALSLALAIREAANRETRAHYGNRYFQSSVEACLRDRE